MTCANSTAATASPASETAPSRPTTAVSTKRYSGSAASTGSAGPASRRISRGRDARRSHVIGPAAHVDERGRHVAPHRRGDEHLLEPRPQRTPEPPGGGQAMPDRYAKVVNAPVEPIACPISVSNRSAVGSSNNAHGRPHTTASTCVTPRSASSLPRSRASPWTTSRPGRVRPRNSTMPPSSSTARWRAPARQPLVDHGAHRARAGPELDDDRRAAGRDDRGEHGRQRAPSWARPRPSSPGRRRKAARNALRWAASVGMG